MRERSELATGSSKGAKRGVKPRAYTPGSGGLGSLGRTGRFALGRGLGHNGVVAETPPTVRLFYRSRRALDADHAAYLVHGGMLVPRRAFLPPAANSTITLEIIAPGGERFRLLSRVGRPIPGQGFLVSFEPEASTEKAALDALLLQPGFVFERDREPLEPIAPPEVALVEAPALDESETTDPLLNRALYPLSRSADAPPPEPPARGAPLDAGEGAPRSSDGLPAEPPARGTPLDAGEEAWALSLEAPSPAMRGTTPRAFDGRRPVPGAGQTVLRRPHPGETYLAAVVRYPTVLSYLPDAEALEATAQLRLTPPPEASVARNDVAELRLTLPGHHVFLMSAVVEGVDGVGIVLRVDPDDERYRRACLFPSSHQARNRREREEESPHAGESRTVLYLFEEMPEELEKMPIRRRLQRMGMDDKINLALSGNREERMALAQDSNRSVHHYLLKNAKLTIDEVAFMARLPSMNPDVLDKIAENPGYTQNPAVTRSLVFNPRTPVTTAIRLLDRLPRTDLVSLSKRTGMNKRLIMAAKSKLSGSKW